MSKLLSIIMPTYKRAWIIEYSLSLIKEQVKRHSEDVELIVCNDASPDNTSEVIEKILKKDPFFKYIDYKEHANGIGISLSRSLDNGTGKYLMFWGDDDVPAPNLIDIIVEKLKQYPDIGCIHFNRLQGNPGEGVGLNNLQVFYRDFISPEILYHSSKEFTKNHYRGMCFLACYVFSKDAWSKGKNIWTSEHFGFEYLAPILYGVKDKECLYLNYPLCIQRFLCVPQYIDLWPLYIYVGIPRVLKCLESLNAIDSWEECYSNYHSVASNFDYVHHILYIVCNNKKIYLEYYDEMYGNLNSNFRKHLFKLVKRPTWLIKIIQVTYQRLPFIVKKMIIPRNK